MGDLTGAIKACEEGLSHYTTFCSQLVTAGENDSHVARNRDEPLTALPSQVLDTFQAGDPKEVGKPLGRSEERTKGDPLTGHPVTRDFYGLIWIKMD